MNGSTFPIEESKNSDSPSASDFLGSDQAAGTNASYEYSNPSTLSADAFLNSQDGIDGTNSTSTILRAVTPATIFTDGNSGAAPLNGSSASMVSAPADPEGTDDLQNVKDATAMTGHLMQIIGGKALDFVGQGLHSLGKTAQGMGSGEGMGWAQMPGDAPVTQIGADIHKAASSIVNADPVLKDSWIGQAAGGSGTMAGMVATSLINPTSAAALFAGGSGEELANAAEKDGQPPEVVDQARSIGTILGAGAAAIPLGQLSKVFSRYNINPYVRSLADGLMEVLPQASIQKRLLYTGIEAAKSGSLGATVGAGYQLGMNAVNNATTGPAGQVPWNQNVGQTAAMFVIPSMIAGGVAPWQRAGTVFDWEPFIDQPVNVTTSQAPVAEISSGSDLGYRDPSSQSETSSPVPVDIRNDVAVNGISDAAAPASQSASMYLEAGESAPALSSQEGVESTPTAPKELGATGGAMSFLDAPALNYSDYALQSLRESDNPEFKILAEAIGNDPAWGLSRRISSTQASNSTDASTSGNQLKAQVAELESSLPEIDLSDLEPVGGGSEHDVFTDPSRPDSVIKTTLPGEFGGIIPDEGGRGSLPSEYFERVAISNALHGDHIEIIGRKGSGNKMQIVTRQPWVEHHSVNGVPSVVHDEEIQKVMRDAGFSKVDKMENAYDHPAGIRVYDAGIGNIIRSQDGTIRPIDVMPLFRPEAAAKFSAIHSARYWRPQASNAEALTPTPEAILSTAKGAYNTQSNNSIRETPIAAHGVSDTEFPQPENYQSGGVPSFKEQQNSHESLKAASQANQASVQNASNHSQGISMDSSSSTDGQQAIQDGPKLWNGKIRTGLSGWIHEKTLPFKKNFFPTSIDESASHIANIIREQNGIRANVVAQVDHALAKWRDQFDKTPVPSGWKPSVIQSFDPVTGQTISVLDPSVPLPHNFALIDAIDRGDIQDLPQPLQDLISQFNKVQDQGIEIARAANPDALPQLRANYFPRWWRNLKEAVSFYGASKRPLEGSKGFMKQRTIAFFRDGLANGLIPMSNNPVDFWLFKIGEISRYAMAQTILQQSTAAGMRKFVGIFEKPPEGWGKVDDRTSTVNAPPFVTVHEAFDMQLRNGALDLIRKMGWNYERTLKNLKAKGFEQNVWGFWRPSDQAIKVRNFTGDLTLFHEIGHGLDHTFHLSEYLDSRIPKDIQETELKRLSDARNPNPGSGKFGSSYINSRSERMAEITAAYIHAPQLLEEAAPLVSSAFRQFLTDHPELHDFRDLRPGLERGAQEVQIPVHGVVTLGHYYMPDGAAQVLNNFLSPGLGSNGLYRGLKSISNHLNMAQLGFSAFHLGFTSIDASISQASIGLSYLLQGKFGKGIRELTEAPIAPISNWCRGLALQKAMLNPSISSASMRYLADLAVKGGLRATVDPFYKSEMKRALLRSVASMTSNLKSMNAKHAASDAVAVLLKSIPALNESLMSIISEGIVPRQKLGVFAKLMEEEMQRLGPDASSEALRAAAARAADTTEDRLGQVVYDNLFMNQVAKDVLKLGFRSYGWTMGKYRALGSAAGGYTRAAKDISMGKYPVITPQMTYVPALIVVVAIIGGITQKILSGKNPESLEDWIMPRTGKLDSNGREQRITPPSYLKDMTSDWHDVPNLKKMGISLFHKLNPAISILCDMLNNKDFYGTEIRHDTDPAWKQALQMCGYLGKSFVPFSVTGAVKLAETGASPDQFILPFIGFVPAKAALTMSPAESRAMDLYVGTLPSGSRTQSQTDHSKLIGQIRATMRQDPAKAEQMITQNYGKLSGADIGRIHKDQGIPVICAQVSRLSLEQGMSVFDLGNSMERKQLAPVLWRKLATAVNKNTIPPDTASVYSKTLSGAVTGSEH